MIRRIRHKAGVFLIVLLLALLHAVPRLPLQSQYKTNPGQQFASPDSHFLLGSDHLGRDLFSRLLWGMRTTVMVAAVACILAVSCGIILGTFAGLTDGWWSIATDMPLSVMLAFPGILFALIIVDVWGRGWMQIAVAIGLSLLPVYARTVRSAVISIRQEVYFEASRAFGADFKDLILLHIFPYLRATTMSEIVTLSIWAISAVVALEYLGMGDNPAESSLGRLILEGRAYIHIAPSLIIIPTIVLVICLLLLSAFGANYSLTRSK